MNGILFAWETEVQRDVFLHSPHLYLRAKWWRVKGESGRFHWVARQAERAWDFTALMQMERWQWRKMEKVAFSLVSLTLKGRKLSSLLYVWTGKTTGSRHVPLRWKESSKVHCISYSCAWVMHSVWPSVMLLCLQLLKPRVQYVPNEAFWHEFQGRFEAFHAWAEVWPYSVIGP